MYIYGPLTRNLPYPRNDSVFHLDTLFLPLWVSYTSLSGLVHLLLIKNIEFNNK